MLEYYTFIELESNVHIDMKRRFVIDILKAEGLNVVNNNSRPNFVFFTIGNAPSEFYPDSTGD